MINVRTEIDNSNNRAESGTWWTDHIPIGPCLSGAGRRTDETPSSLEENRLGINT